VRTRQLSRFVVAITLLSMIFAGVAGDRLAWAADSDFINVTEPATAAPDTASTTVDVTIEAVEALIASTTSLALPTQAEARLVSELAVAKNAFEHAFPRVAVNRLTSFVGEVEVQRGSALTDQQADRLIGQAKQIISCM
jgi:hypothetical protein